MVFNGEKKLATFFPFYLVLETFMEFIMDLDRTFNGILGILIFSPNLTNSNIIRTSNVKKRRRIPIGEALGIFFSRLQLVFFYQIDVLFRSRFLISYWTDVLSSATGSSMYFFGVAVVWKRTGWVAQVSPSSSPGHLSSGPAKDHVGLVTTSSSPLGSLIFWTAWLSVVALLVVVAELP